MRREYLFAVTFLMLAVMLGGYATTGGYWLVLAWPALAFGIVAFAYAIRSPKVFLKRSNGSRGSLATIVLAPYLGFVYVTWQLQLCFSREQAYARINETLFISRPLFARELPNEVKRVCDLACELSDSAVIRSMTGYLCYPILDASISAPEKLVALAKALPPSVDCPLLVHCANGHGRTGMFAAIWLLTHGFAMSPSEAMQSIQAVRPHAKLGREQYATVEKAFDILRSAHS